MAELRLLPLLLLPLALGAAESVPGNQRWYVAPDGRDAGSGTQAQPFATLAKAQEAVRARKPGTSATVILAPGTWYLAAPLHFTAADSGTASAPVIWKAATPGTVRLVGGQHLDPSAFAPVADPQLLGRLPAEARGNVLSAPLQRLGLTAPAPVAKAFIGNGTLPALYEDDALLPVARWPNDGFATIKEILDSGLEPKPHGGTFRVKEDRPGTWAQARPDEGWWLEGYWRVPWVIEGVPVAAVNPQERTITLGAPVGGGLGSKYSQVKDGTRIGDGKERYRVRNLLEELDQPGEWVLNSATRSLLIWPRSGTAAHLTLICGTGPTLEITDAAHLHFEHLDIAGGMAGAVDIHGGAEVAILGCRIRNTPGQGIEIKGGQHHLVQGCDLHDLGAEGIDVAGGDRATLIPGEHRILNNHIHHFGQIRRVVSGINLTGVGLDIRNNLIHDSPYGGITLGGNDHLIELNEIHNIGLEGGDLGGVYTGADWTSWGNKIRHNLIHHARTANGVYLDDGDSGDEVEGNIFYQIASGPFVGGGSNHWIHGNVAIDCTVGIHLDDRGVSRRYGAADSSQRKQAEKLKITQPPWSDHYPDLAKWYTTEDLSLPTNNVLEDNLLIACPKGVDYRMGKANRERFILNGTQELARNPGYRDPAALDFTRDAAAVLPEGVTLPKIPVERIGLVVDAWRPVLPTAAATGRLTARQPVLNFDSNTDLKKTNDAATGTGKP